MSNNNNNNSKSTSKFNSIKGKIENLRSENPVAEQVFKLIAGWGILSLVVFLLWEVLEDILLSFLLVVIVPIFLLTLVDIVSVETYNSMKDAIEWARKKKNSKKEE